MESNATGIPPAIIAAAISFLGAVIFVPFINRALTQYFDKRSRLSISISLSEFHPSKYLQKIIGNPFEIGLPERDRKIRQVFFNLRGYAKIEISNDGSTAIKNITLSLVGRALTDAVVQVEGNDETHVLNQDDPFKVGDLQPKLKKLVHLYADMSVFGFDGRAISKDLHISADQIDRIRYHRGGPEHVSLVKVAQKIDWLLKISAALSILSVVYYTITFYIHH